MPVPPTDGTTSSWTPPRCRSPTPSAHRSIRWPCAEQDLPGGTRPGAGYVGSIFDPALAEAALTWAVRADAAPPPTTGPVRGSGAFDPGTRAPIGAALPV